MKNNGKDNEKNKGANKSAAAEPEISDVRKEEQIIIDRDKLTDAEYIECLEEKLGQCMAESVNCRNLTQRIQADFDNYRRRNAGISEEMKRLGESMVIEKMLTVLDNCDLARKFLNDEASLTGFNMMERQILDALETFGLKEIEAEGKEFDAKLMSAVEREKSEGNEGKVIGVLAKGYTLNGKLLRPASVKVGG